MDDVRVAPSILSADFARLGEQVELVMDAGARVIHVDVMDGHFVPPITIGPLIVESLRDLVHDRGGVLDVHLMVERPEQRVEEFAAAGADTLIVHWEATPHVHYALKAVREAGLNAGLAINPATPPEAVAVSSRRFDHAALHDGQPGLGRPALHRHLHGQGGPPARAARPGRADRGGRRHRRGHGGPRRGGGRDAVRGGLVDLRRAGSRRRRTARSPRPAGAV